MRAKVHRPSQRQSLDSVGMDGVHEGAGIGAGPPDRLQVVYVAAGRLMARKIHVGDAEAPRVVALDRQPLSLHEGHPATPGGVREPGHVLDSPKPAAPAPADRARPPRAPVSGGHGQARLPHGAPDVRQEGVLEQQKGSQRHRQPHPAAPTTIRCPLGRQPVALRQAEPWPWPQGRASRHRHGHQAPSRPTSNLGRRAPCPEPSSTVHEQT